MTFGVVLLGQSPPLGPESFSTVGATSYALELSGPLGAHVESTREAALFLTSAASLSPDSALALYVSAGTSAWEFRGYVCSSKPSDSFPVSWPRDHVNGGTISPPVCLGVQCELLSDAQQKEGKQHASREEWARRVGLDLFRFMESFQGSHEQDVNDCMLVPGDAFDRWWNKFNAKYSRDPMFLLRDRDSL